MYAHIELVGLAGSGKSTLSGFIKESAADRSVSLYDNQRAYYRCFFRAAVHDRFGPISDVFPPRVLRYITRNNDWGTTMQTRFQVAHPGVHGTMEQLLHKYATDSSRKEWMIQRYGLTEAQYQAAQEYLLSDESILFDEGFIHYASSLLCPPRPKHALTEDDIHAYLDAIPLPDYCIFTRAPIGICKRRMETRKKGGPGQYSQLSATEFDRYLQRAEECRRLLKSTLEETSVEVIEFDTSTSLEETAEKAQRFVALKTDYL